MKKDIFVISDIHGHYLETIRDLKNSGWDDNNPSHLLIVCGDLFDRGLESLEVFLWLYDLTSQNKAVVLKGNHDDMFIDWLKNDTSNFNWRYNGLNTTIDSFDERTSSFYSWILIDKNINLEKQQKIDEIEWNELWYEWSNTTKNNIKNNFPNLLEWLESLPNYYETNNYIFTHGSIDGKCKDWKNPTNGWDYHHWDKGFFINELITNTSKTIIVGHFHTGHLRNMHQIDSKNESDNSILYYNNKIFLDTCTILSKVVNVLILKDEKLSNDI